MYLEEKAVPLPGSTSPVPSLLRDHKSSQFHIEHPEYSEEGHESGIYAAYILLLLLMLIYVTAGTWMERRKCVFGHETGIVIILGIAVGGILKATEKDISTGFNPTVLFDFGLPFILYAAGYNMRRRRFFDDINNITMFGVLSTVVCFVVLSLLTVVCFNSDVFHRFIEAPDGSM